MTTSIAILKILSLCPEGRASFASLKAGLVILGTPEWHACIRTLATKAGAVGLFSSKLATRDASGWAITDAGREFLERLESGEELLRQHQTERPVLEVVASKAYGSEVRGYVAAMKLARSA